MPMPTFPLVRLGAFRSELHACFPRRADALFELGDALLCAPAVPSLPHLSLEPVHRRGWGSVYAALSSGRIDAERLRDLLASSLPSAGPLVFAVDVTTWPRCDAECSPERGYYYHPSRHSAGQPIVAGWAPPGVAGWLGAGGAVVVDAVVMLLGGAAVMLRRPEIAWLDAPPYRRPESRRPILRQSRSNGSSRSRIGQTPSCETLSAHPRRSGVDSRTAGLMLARVAIRELSWRWSCAHGEHVPRADLGPAQRPAGVRGRAGAAVALGVEPARG
jgi:hypothetical protein